MSKYLRYTFKNLLSPCLINIIGIKRIEDYENKPTCKSLMYEENCENFQLNQIENEQSTLLQEAYSNMSYSCFSDIAYKYENFRNILYQETTQANEKNNELQRRICAVLNREFFGKFIVTGKFDNNTDFSNPSRSWSKYTNAVTIAVSIDGKLMLKIAFNNQDRENLVPTKEDMVGCIGSITKTFTAMMIMKLIEEEAKSGRENKITLDSYVEDILTPDVWPEHFVENDRDGRTYKITIKHLLQHLSGVRGNTIPLPDEYLNTGYGSLEESIKVIKDVPLQHIPGEFYVYSNYGYQLLALVYEKRTGRSFVEDLRDEFAKMGLYDTEFYHRDYLALDKARGYQFRRSINDMGKVPYEDLSWFEASYGLVSTTSDLIKYGNIISNYILKDDDEATFPISVDSMLDILYSFTVEYAHRHPCFNLRGTENPAFSWSFLDYKGPDEGGPFHEQLFYHDGSTPEAYSCLAIFRNNIEPVETDATLQDKPLIYPLGEKLSFEENVVVGAIITDRSLLNEHTTDLLHTIMNLVYSTYVSCK